MCWIKSPWGEKSSSQNVIIIIYYNNLSQYFPILGITLLRVEKFPSSPERIQRRRLIYDGPKSSRDDGRRGRSVRPRRLDGPFGRFGAFGAACVVGRASDERRRRVGRRGAAGPGRAAPGPTPPPQRAVVVGLTEAGADEEDIGSAAGRVWRAAAVGSAR